MKRSLRLIRLSVWSDLAFAPLVRANAAAHSTTNDARGSRRPRLISMRTVLTVTVWLALAVRPSFADAGILLLAHGGSAEWNAGVSELAARVDAHKPTEVAFGMASRATIQAAVDRLAARGVFNDRRGV